MKYGILDPRKTEDARLHNEQLLGNQTLGIEVTIPELSDKCGLGNIDPQHTEGKQQAAIKFVAKKYQNWENLPDEETTLVTVRPDLDSIGAMALMSIFKDQQYQERLYPGGSDAGIYAYYGTFGLNEDMQAKVDMIAKSDSFQNGSWQPYPLPSKDNPWPAKNASAGDIKELAAMAAAVADFKVPIADRVRWVIDWLLWDREPEGYREKVEKERMEMIMALENGKIKLNVYESNMSHPISVVESTYRAGTMLGYSQAPIVVAINPEFRFQNGESHRKVTIAQFTADYVNLKAVTDRLNKYEPGWGGSQIIVGSPQGKSTNVNVDFVIQAIRENIL